ncbi:hypothetical protein HOC80_01950 [archaeon]|jgi:hypothetical protein|nr:hypothetical protein [archaeon]MBT4416845.1 hypothetical protein [archaeon]
MDKVCIGLVEDVEVGGKVIKAKIDTGARGNSISKSLAEELGLEGLGKTILVKSASGQQVRPLVGAEIVLKGKKLDTHFNVADRSHLQYQILIGVEVLKQGFLIDPSL